MVRMGSGWRLRRRGTSLQLSEQRRRILVWGDARGNPSCGLRRPRKLFGIRSAALLGADQRHSNDAIFNGAILPGVAGAVLNGAIAGFEEDFRAVVEFEIDFAGKDDVEIHGRRGVHAGVHWFEDFSHAGKLGLDFGEGSGKISVLWNFAGAGRHGEECEAESAGWREVARM